MNEYFRTDYSEYLTQSQSYLSPFLSQIPLANQYFGEQVPPAERGWAERFNDAFTLPYTQRVIAFVACVCLGGVFLFLSTYFIIFPQTFAKYYTLGCILLTMSTFFLMGPVRQLQMMFSETRWLASTIYISSMLATLVCAVKLQSTLLTFACILVQIGAALWYAGSYIPFFQTIATGSVASLLPL